MAIYPRHRVMSASYDSTPRYTGNPRHVMPYTPPITLPTQVIPAPVSATAHVAQSPRFTPTDSQGDVWDTMGRTL